MPELAEVEFFRKQWNPGLHNRVLSVEIHSGTRVYRDADGKALWNAMRGRRLLASEAQ
jgi:formamidopyrimidine-DNA glycosylase